MRTSFQRWILTEVALVCVEANGESVDITDGVGRSTTASNSREPNEDGSLLARLVQERGSGDV